MERLERGILLFLVLVLALSISVSYLGANQAAHADRQDDVQKMTIALVNEDQGAVFNGTPYDFGDEFIKSVERDDTHDWYVVSRGVAESGFARNVYNMIIIIPHDFSQRALSIDSVTPENVQLNYKINASENSHVRAEAERTAQSILNDFNRRIIDVYFASVIGNLNDAQDNIKTIVEKEALYTHTFNNAINQPLSDYTDQFQAVQDNTQLSRDSFQGLQEILDVFEESLGNNVETNRTYLTNYEDFISLKEANSLLFNDFSNQLGLLDRGMHDGDVMQQLRDLERANEAIYEQFRKSEEDRIRNIVSESAVIQQYLAETNEKVSRMKEQLESLITGMEEHVTNELTNAFKSSFNDRRVTLKDLSAELNNRSHQSIQEQINKLPSLNVDDIEELGFSKETVTLLTNIIGVTNKYIRENDDFAYEPTDQVITLTKLVHDIKQSLSTVGVNVNDSVILPETQTWGQRFTLTIPDEYKVTEVWLKLPGENEEEDYTEEYNRSIEIRLPATEKGLFTVRLNLQLIDEDSAVDVFQAVTWSWHIHQHDETDDDNIGIPSPPPLIPEVERPSANQVAVSKHKKEDNRSDNIDEESKSGDGNTEVRNSDDNNGDNGIRDNEDDNGENGENGEDDNGENGDDGNGAPGEGDDPPTPPIERVVITDKYITHKIMSPLTVDAPENIINAAADTVNQYHRMQIMYESYFGLDMEREDLLEALWPFTLTEWAEQQTDSFYHLFNNEDILQSLQNYVVNEITVSLTAQVRGQVETMQSQVEAYRLLIEQANADSEQMARLIERTTEETAVMNANLAHMLEELKKWRDASLDLVDEQMNILLNVDEEQTVAMAMNGEFNTLLTESQALADQAEGNLRSADTVYDTFDAIDNQARAIQESGTTLFNQANELSNNLTDKLAEDEEFADNFSDVLANSRIGDRPNEALYSFLANPVQANNDGVIVAGDRLTPYFLILICFIVALFTAYVISTYDQRRIQTDTFAQDKTLVRRNIPITAITASVGLVEGIAIGALSGYFLSISQENFVMWTGLIVLVMLTIVFAATYLLRQLKMIGMFLLMIVLSVYLFFTEVHSVDFDRLSLAATIQLVSPLQYMETLLSSFARGNTDYHTIMYSLIAVALIGLVANMFVVHRSQAEDEEVEDDGVSEAQ